MRHHYLVKKILCYTLSLAVFLQPQIVAAVEIISLEDVQRSQPLLFEQRSYYIKQITSVASGRDLCLQLNADLAGLQHPLILFSSRSDQPEEREQLALLSPTDGGLLLETMSETPPLVLTQGSGLLPSLKIRSFKPVTVDVERLENPLSVHAAHIILARSMQVEKELCLWTIDLSQEGSAPSQTSDQLVKTILKGSGTITAKSLQGKGNLTLVSGKFQNANLIHLNTVQLFTNLRNTKEGNIAANETLSVSGSVRNDGIFRSKLNILEDGEVIRHTATSQIYAGLIHQITCNNYESVGKTSVGLLTQIKSKSIKLGAGYTSYSRYFMARAQDYFNVYNSCRINARHYIELANRHGLVNGGYLQVEHHVFPHGYFFELGHPDARPQLRGVEARLAREEGARQISKEVMKAEDKIRSAPFYGHHGVLLASDSEMVSQNGYVKTSSSDLILKAPRAYHYGTSAIGDVCPGLSASLRVKASQEAIIKGTVKASGALVTEVGSHLVLGGVITVPFVESSLAKTINFSGVLKADLLRIANAQRVSMLPSSANEVTHTRIIDVDHLDMAGVYTGTDLLHTGKTLALGGTTTIETVSAQEADSAIVSGTHAGHTLALKADKSINLTEASRVALQTGVLLDAPDKTIAGHLKTQTLVTRGANLDVTKTAQVEWNHLQSEDSQSVTLDAERLSIEEADIRAKTLTLGSAAASSDTPLFNFGKMRAEVSAFKCLKRTTFSKESYIKAAKLFENHAICSIHQFLRLDLPENHTLGTLEGLGFVDLKAPLFRDVESLLAGQTGVRVKGGIGVTTQQDVVIEQEHVVDHAMDLTAKSVTVQENQTSHGGLAYQSTNGAVTVEDITLTAPGKSILLDAQGGPLNAQDLTSSSDRLHFASSGDGNFGGATCSAPIMTSDVRGTLHTSTPDVLVPGTTQPKSRVAHFLSHGQTQDGQKAVQHLKGGRYDGQGIKETEGGIETVTDRVTHSAEGPVLLDFEKGVRLSRAHIAAQGNMFSVTSKQEDITLTNVRCQASQVQMIAEQGNVDQESEVLRHQYSSYQAGRTGGSGEYSYQTYTSGETQRAEGNILEVDGEDQVGADGRIIPAVLIKAGRGKSIRSKFTQIHAPNGTTIRQAHEGTISDTAQSLTSWHTQSHHTQGKGFANNWYSHSTSTTEQGGAIQARDRVDDTETVRAVGLDSIVTRDFLIRAQNVFFTSALNEFRSRNSMTSQRDGSDMFSQGGSVSFHENTHALSTIPMIQYVGGHYMEIKPRPDEPGTRTLEGDVRFKAGVSTFTLNLVLKAIKEFTETTSTLQMDNTSSFQRPQFVSVPRFKFQDTTQTVRDINQTLSQVNEFLSLLNNLKYDNYQGLAFQALRFASKFTNIQSSHFEQRLHSYMSSEAAPSLESGLTFLKDITIEGVLAGWKMHAPRGRAQFNVHAPRIEARSESTTTQETDSVNPLAVSIGHAETHVTQTQSARGSKPSIISISGHADLDIPSATLEGVDFVTVKAGDKHFTQTTKRIMLGGVEQEVTLIREVGKDSGFVLIPEQKGKGVVVQKMSVIAAEYETRSDMEMTQSSWSVSLGELIATVATGGSPIAIALAAFNSVNISDTGNSQHTHHRGTQPAVVNAGGDPIHVIDFHSRGNVTLAPSVTVEKRTHEASPEIHTSSSSSYNGFEMLDQFKDGLSLGSNMMGLIDNVNKLQAPVPTKAPHPSDEAAQPTGQERVSLEQHLLGVSRDEGADADPKDTSGRGTRRASGRSANPDGNPPRARTRPLFTDSERSARSTIDALNHAGSEADQARSFLNQVSYQATDRANGRTGASSRSARHQANRPTRLDLSDINPQAQNPVQNLGHFMDRVDTARAVNQQRQSQPLFSMPQDPPSPTPGNRIKLNVAQANFEAAKGPIESWKAYQALQDAKATYFERISERQAQQRADDAVGFIKENPKKAATYAAATVFTVATLPLTGVAAVGSGAIGGGLFGLASNDFNVSTPEAQRDIAISILMGGCAPLRPLYSAGAGLGISGYGYAIGSTSTMVGGGLLTLPGIFGAGRSLAQNLFAKAPVTENLFSRVAANSNFRNTLSHALPMETVHIAQPANQNMVRLLFDVRATGTHGGPSFFVRMSEGSGSGLPRGGFSAGHAEGLGAGSASTRSVPSHSGSSGPSQAPFIKRIDKKHAQSERMMRDEAALSRSPYRITDETVHPSIPVGSKDKPLPSFFGDKGRHNLPTTISGREYSGHALDRMMQRGLKPSLIENAIKNSPANPSKEFGKVIHADPINNISVVVDQSSGKVVTVSFGVFK